MAEFAIIIEGLKGGDYIGDLPPARVANAARMAVNKIAARARTKADREIREQIAFPASYLGPASKRLWIQTKASNSNLEATIRGQGRPTSLARFSKAKPVSGGRRHKDNGVPVTVKPGQRKFIKRGFIMRLKNDNFGLAVRTSGGLPPNAWKPKLIGNNLYLLYGPSVDQALIDARQSGGIYVQITDEVLNELETEFYRLIEAGVA